MRSGGVCQQSKPGGIKDRVLAAATWTQRTIADLPPFSGDTSRSRQTAFAKIRALVPGTQLAAQALGIV
jgi:hypothetical protein